MIKNAQSKIRPSITLGRIMTKNDISFKTELLKNGTSKIEPLRQLNGIKGFREQSHDVRYHGDNVHHQN